MDANTTVTAQPTLDEKIDSLLDGKQDQSESSTEETAVGKESTETQQTGQDQSKSESTEEAVEKQSTVEDKLAKIQEILGDDEEAINAYIHKHGYHKDPAWQKLLSKAKSAQAIDAETQKRLEEFKTITSSREYIESSMRARGYTDEAINKELKAKGFDVVEKGIDDVTLVMDKLGLKPDQMDDNTKAIVSDVVKIVDILLSDRLDKRIPNELKPIRETVTGIARKESAAEMAKTMRKTVQDEGILDFDKDIAPELNKYIDENPESTQEDAFNYFTNLNHKLSLERLRLGKKQVERDEKKTQNRPTKDTVKIDATNAPKRQAGQSLDGHLDNLLDHFNIK